MNPKKLTTCNVDEFCDELASESPAPGGGSVAALAGALAACLTSMVSRLTIGKKKYADVEDDMKAVLECADRARAGLLKLVDEDTAAYSAVMAAYKLPRETPEDVAARDKAIQDATRTAIAVPLEVAKQAAAVLDLALTAVEKGNVNAASDAGVAGLLAHAAVQGALLNVRINLGAVTDKSVAAETKKVAAKIQTRAAGLSAKIQAAVAARIGG